MKTIILTTLALIVGLFAILELGMRSLFGFGNPLIYIGDENIGYLLAPNQKTRRFGNLIEINQYSMRSESVNKKPASSTLRILLLGDSIANGGWWTDQKNTVSNLTMQALIPHLKKLSVSTKSNFTKVEVLNASANSWGPRNELAYLQKFGSFDSLVIILLINTDDLFSTTPTSLPVGRDRNYPNRQPPLAIAEIFGRYIIKQKPIPELAEMQNEQGDRVGTNLAAIAEIQNFAGKSNSQLLLAMTPLLRELGNPGPRDYEIKARKRLTDFTQERKITYIDFLTILNSLENPQDLYHDHIHFNLKGNQVIRDNLKTQLLQLWK
ncbi:MAG: SGNH/GDSL hydrolase family protein [Cyanobacteria bacterium P01_A01_bin.84]